jgi:nitroimidazol reductase NimA-like FMN-containing flavoprotein (pyridoxamine 5'-phosphate oxidase superfamily)
VGAPPSRGGDHATLGEAAVGGGDGDRADPELNRQRAYRGQPVAALQPAGPDGGFDGQGDVASRRPGDVVTLYYISHVLYCNRNGAVVSIPPAADASPLRPLRPTERTRVRRLPERGSQDWAVIAGILDEALVCHVGFVVDGAPVVIPTGHARVGTTLYLHGSPASRMLRTVARGVDVCVTATVIDGLVLARSLFHHSINYRSVVAFGRAVEVTDLDEKGQALCAFAEHVLPGRAAEARAPNVRELKATRVLALPLDEASAKLRVGPPLDDAEDMELGIWAGVLPVGLGIRPVVAETHELEVPPSVLAATRSPRYDVGAGNGDRNIE